MEKMQRFRGARGAMGSDGVSVAAWALHAFTTNPHWRDDPSRKSTDVTRFDSTIKRDASPPT
jgi:hypothetical protein